MTKDENVEAIGERTVFREENKKTTEGKKAFIKYIQNADYC